MGHTDRMKWNLSLYAHIVAGLLFCAGLYVYAGSLQVGFVGDDYLFLHTSRTLTDVGDAFAGDWFWKRDDFVGARYYRPLIIAGIYVEQSLFGQTAAWFHLTNLLMHALCTALVYWLVRLSLHNTAFRPIHAIALIAALLFWLHPRHPEAVTMINGRTDVQCTLFVLLSLCTYLKWKYTGTRSWLWGSYLALATGLLSKEMAITLPAILVLIEWTNRKQIPVTATGMVQSIRPTLGHWLLVAALFGVVRTWALGGQVFGQESYLISDQPHMLFLFDAVCKLTLLLIIPFDSLATILQETLPAIHVLIRGEGGALGLSLFLLGSGYAIVQAIRRGSVWASLGLGLWILTAAPIINQLGLIDSQVGDRYLYLPSIGAMLLVPCAGFWLQRRISLPALPSLTALLLLMLGFLVQLHTDIREWMIAGQTAQSIHRQLETLDEQRLQDETFVIINLPVFYKDKTVLHAGLGTYLSREREIREQSSRNYVCPQGITLLEEPEETSASLQWQGETLQVSLSGAHYTHLLSPDQQVVTIAPPRTDDPAVRTLQFPPLRQRILLILYDKGKLIPLNPNQHDVLVAEGPCGETWIHRYRMTQNSIHFPEEIKAQVGDVVSRFQHDPFRSVYLSSGDLDGDGRSEFVCTFGPTHNPRSQFPGMVVPYQMRNYRVLGHPFTPFPRKIDNILENPFGEVRTAIGRFIPGLEKNQLACATGFGGQQVIRLYVYTDEAMPNAWKIVSQVRAFDVEKRALNQNGGVTLSAGDLDQDGLDELVVGQTPSQSSTTAIQVISFSSQDEQGLAWIESRSPWVEVFPEPMRMGGGVTHTVVDSDGDGPPCILAGSMGWQRPASAKPLGAFVIPVMVESRDGSITALHPDPEQMTQIFSPGESPSGALSLSAGNIDFVPGDEVAFSTAFYPDLIGDDLCMRWSQAIPEPIVRVGSFTLSKPGSGIEDIPSLSNTIWNPFRNRREKQAVSASVSLIAR